MKVSRMLTVGITGLLLAIVLKKMMDTFSEFDDHDEPYLFDTNFLSNSKFDYEKMLPPVKPRAHLRIHSDEDELFI